MELDLSVLEPRHAHDVMTSAIIPRPIAWVSTADPEGRVNLAPFSFFTGVSYSPPVLAFSVMNRPDGSEKDTILNIRRVPEFVVHIVSVEHLPVMELTARPIPCSQDESTVEGIRLLPSKRVRPCRIGEAKVAFECALERIVVSGSGPCAGNLVLGRILLAHVQDGLLMSGRVADPGLLDALGRLSGNRYCTTRSVIVSETN